MVKWLSFLVFALLLCAAGCSRLSDLPGEQPTRAPTISLPAGDPPVAETGQPVETPAFLPGSLPSIWVANPADRSVLRIDTEKNVIAASIPVDGRPDIAVYGEGAVWALDRQVGQVFRIDPVKDRVTATVVLPPGKAEAIATGAGAVWVGLTGKIDMESQLPDHIAYGQETEMVPPAVVLRIDPQQNEIVDELPVQPVSRLAVSGTALWVLSRSVIDTPLQVFDLGNRQGMAVPIRNAPEWLPADALAVNSEGLWLFSSAYGKIFRAGLNGQIISAIPLDERRPVGYADLLLTGAGGLWAATPWGTVLHADRETNHLLGQIDLGVPLTGLIDGQDAVWVLSQQAGALYRIDPETNAVVAQIATGSRVQPTIIPSPTPRVVIWKPCPDAASSRLKIGDLAYVTKDPPLPNRVRQEPNKQAEILGLINPGGSMEIIEGPACAEGWVWWKVKNADLTGWTPEGDLETYWLVPLYK